MIGIDDKVQLIFDYKDTAKVMHLLDKYSAKVVTQQCGDQTLMQVNVNKGLRVKFVAEAKENGKIAAKVL